MRFADLMTLPFDEGTDVISMDAVREALPRSPNDVIEQVYVEHGRKEEFQNLYGTLVLDDIMWNLESWTASELSLASYNPSYRSWFEAVRQRANRFEAERWRCVDVRPTIREHWARHKTWLRPPVLIHGRRVGSSAAIHLMEGHTRVALLYGLVAAGIIPRESGHLVWMGS